MNVTIERVQAEHLAEISVLAALIWRAHYPGIITPAQIDYMLARSYDVDETEIGIEWQPSKNFELVAMYTISKRRFEDFAKQDNLQEGRLLRLQAQLNF